MSVKTAVASGIILEKQMKETTELLANTIAQCFTQLANSEPNLALHVLNQMNEQFNEEIANEIDESIAKQIELISQKVHIPEEELD